MTRSVRRPSTRTLVAVGGLAVIGAVHLGPVRLTLEDRLAERARAELASVGLDGVSVTVTGLGARLAGDVPREVDIDLAVSAVDRVPAVTAIDRSGLVVRAPAGTGDPAGGTPAAPAATPTATPAATPTTADPAAVARARAGLTGIGPITFEPNSVVLTDDGLASVAEVARIIAATGSDVRFRVEAHTDSGGPPDANKALSLRRATAVRAALLELGVARTRVQAVGFGETRPLVTPEVTDADRQANRRVEVVAEAVPGL